MSVAIPAWAPASGPSRLIRLRRTALRNKQTSSPFNNVRLCFRANALTLTPSPAPPSQHVRPLDPEYQAGAAALAEAMGQGGKLDLFATVVKIYQHAGMISSRAEPRHANGPSESRERERRQ